MYEGSCGAAAAGQCGAAQREGEAAPREPQPAPPERDYSGFDIVKATQYGAFERVKELVEAGWDVNQPDHETVTLLHWAAINNRREIISFLLERGAAVDARGGELQATPLQWAARQGHLEAAVLLLRAGADAALRDAEGCASLHLAAQFGHTAVVAYLVARGGSPDEPDAGGMTPLMWACWKVAAVDPARLLLTLGASPAPADRAHGNTALHWAVLARNGTAVATLLLYGNASLDAPNLRGATPLAMLRAQLDAPWLGAKAAERVREHAALRERRPLLRRLAYDRKFRWWCVVLVPFVAFYLTGLLLEADAALALKALLLGALYAALHCVTNALMDDELKNLFPLCVYLATKLWFYITWAVFVAPVVSAAATAAFLLASLALWYTFLRSWRSDPGVIRATRADKLRTIIELSERGRGGRRLRAGALLLGVPAAAAAALQALLRVQPLRRQVRPPLPLGRQLHRRQQPPPLRGLPGQPAADVRLDAVGRVARAAGALRRRVGRVGRVQPVARVGVAERRLPPGVGGRADGVPAVPGGVPGHDHQRAAEPRALPALRARRPLALLARPAAQPGRLPGRVAVRRAAAAAARLDARRPRRPRRRRRRAARALRVNIARGESYV